MRVTLGEPGECGRKKIRPDNGRDADLDDSLLSRPVIIHLGNQIAQARKDVIGPLQAYAAFRSERNLFLAAIQQRDAQLLFKLFYGNGDRRLGNMQFGSGFGNAPHPARSLKIFHLPQLQCPALHH
jgi:hypothetical protein